MAHVFFFNYAHENRDKQLEAFFEDLCAEVAPYTPWAADDLRISFRDGQNLALMQEWRPALLKALQTSAVLVAITSPAYFQKRFCGQEYYIFDQRRRQKLNVGRTAAGCDSSRHLGACSIRSAGDDRSGAVAKRQHASALRNKRIALSEET